MNLRHCAIGLCLLIFLQPANANPRIGIGVGKGIIDAKSILQVTRKFSAAGLRLWKPGASNAKKIAQIREALANFQDAPDSTDPDDGDKVTYLINSPIGACNISGCKVSAKTKQANTKMLLDDFQSNIQSQYVKAITSGEAAAASFETYAAQLFLDLKYYDTLAVYYNTTNKIEPGFIRFIHGGAVEINDGHDVTVYFRSTQLLTNGKLEDQYEYLFNNFKEFAIEYLNNYRKSSNSVPPNVKMSDLNQIINATPTTVINQQISKMLDSPTQYTIKDIQVQLGPYELNSANLENLKTRFKLVGSIDKLNNRLLLLINTMFEPKMDGSIPDVLEISQFNNITTYPISSEAINGSEISILLRGPLQAKFTATLGDSEVFCVEDEYPDTVPQTILATYSDDYNNDTSDTKKDPTFSTGKKIAIGATATTGVTIFILGKWLFSAAAPQGSISSVPQWHNGDGFDNSNTPPSKPQRCISLNLDGYAILEKTLKNVARHGQRIKTGEELNNLKNDLNQTLLLRAAFTNSMEDMEYLLKKFYANPEEREAIIVSDKWGRNVLHYAFKNDNWEMLELLLESLGYRDVTYSGQSLSKVPGMNHSDTGDSTPIQLAKPKISKKLEEKRRGYI